MKDPEFVVLLLCGVAFMLLIISAQIATSNKRLEQLNDRLQVFWEEYVRKGGADRHDDF